MPGTPVRHAHRTCDVSPDTRSISVEPAAVAGRGGCATRRYRSTRPPGLQEPAEKEPAHGCNARNHHPRTQVCR